MIIPLYTRQFERDVKRMGKRGKNIEKLKIIVSSLAGDEPIDPIHKDHKFLGDWQGRRECHIESDWILIYKVEETRVIFERTGTHADLFR